MSNYDNGLTEQCIQYYKTLLPTTSTQVERNQISSEVIDRMQRINASEKYQNMIYEKFYSSYPEKQFISQDRELNTNWIEQVDLFHAQSLVEKSMMIRYKDGLLPGHIYMLYWLEKYKNKRIPVYFEYKYGIEFEKEKIFLEENGFLNNGVPTVKGKDFLEQHINVVEEHSSKI